jgi:hypothetical protein
MMVPCLYGSCMLQMQVMLDGDDVRNAMQARRRNEQTKETTNRGSVYEYIYTQN